MRNDQWDRKPNTRPVPSSCPELIPVSITRSQHKEREQWTARYPVYMNGNESDYVDIVVNFNDRFSRYREWRDHDMVWVRPTAMAAHARVIFADYWGEVHESEWDMAAFPYRIGQELKACFSWNTERKRYESEWRDDYRWRLVLATEIKLQKGEEVRVRVTAVPRPGEVAVSFAGFGAEQQKIAAPELIGYLQVRSLYGKPISFEGDVAAYHERCASMQEHGGAFDAVVETADDVYVFSCNHLRRSHVGARMLIGTVTMSGRQHGQLCELVWVEGQPTSKMPIWQYEQERRRASPTPSEKRGDEQHRCDEEQREREDAEQAWQDYLDEERYNSDRPDYD